ncbi:putative phosphoglycerate mutase [Pseudonocardia sediminis]|uniref:Putative phosphoglycerate mutase n=1 Tax=Pseudonocardia sediminis TaxID=1397368 RepID=A0A4Q7V272_PSEST|nr:histidine phosphatase family protein [Pseudonocardia sediminis]RZT88456.1 putative phosphoglycerate mutase [Pseudonocardia sediminis]
MDLILVRHGRPETVRSDGDLRGGADPGLTEEGHRQADLLGRYLARDGAAAPDVVVTSPMRRARETARALETHLHLPVRVDPRLAEFDIGAPAYVPAESVTLDREVLWRALETGEWGAHTFDPDAFEARVAEAFTEIIAANAGATVAVVCHNGVINSFLSVVLGRPRGMFVQPDYTSFSRLVAARSGRRQLRSINETPHLQLARSPAEPRARPA